jgi:uncharacterized membrane protein YciS (DUF1049 family)
MRVLSFLFLIAFAAAVGIFAYQNNQVLTLNLFGQVQEVSVPLLAGGLYVLGMFTGWAVVGLLRRSWTRATEYDRR